MLIHDSNLLSLRDGLQAIFRRRKLVLLVFAMTMIPVTVATFVATKVYRATAKVLVRREDRPGTLNSHYSRLDQDEDIRSELEIATSRPVLEATLWAGLAQSERIDGLTIEQYRILLNWGVPQNEIAQRNGGAAVPQVDVREPAPTVSTPRGDAETNAILEKTLDLMRRRVHVEAVTGANVIALSFDDTDPQWAAWFANKLASEYAAYNAEVHGGEEAEKFLAERINETRTRLDSLGQALHAYRASTGLVAHDKQENLMYEKYRAVDYQLAQLREQAEVLAGKVQRLREVRAVGDSLVIPTPEMDAHPSVRQLYGRLTEFRLERNALVEKYQPDHRLVIDLDKQIRGVQAELVAEVDRLLALENERLGSLRREERVLSKMVDKVKWDIQALPKKERVLDEMNLAIENARKIYSLLVMRREEMSVEKAADRRLSRITIISPAGVPFEPVGPRTARNLMLGLILSLFAGIAAGLVREFYDRTFKSPQELAATLGIPVLGTISAEEVPETSLALKTEAAAVVNGQANGRQDAPDERHKLEVRLWETPAGGRADFAAAQVGVASRRERSAIAIPALPASNGGQPATVFRGRRLPHLEIEKLRSEILMLRRSHNARIIGFASAQAGDGASTVLANLAVEFGKLDLQVLMIDLNVAHPNLPELFSFKHKPGLIDLMDGRRDLHEVTRTIIPGRVYVMPLGRRSATTNFPCERALPHLHTAMKCFDLVLLDLPPLTEFSPALQLARHLNGVVQVVQAERTRVDVLQSAKHELERLGIQVFGAVLNRRKFHIPKFIYNQL
jgi:uncharacterized protein involved in exopolysaccharide biosynthesis/Mrp family chromosome partitioning ATPase